jgi:hypothetical protein
MKELNSYDDQIFDLLDGIATPEQQRLHQQQLTDNAAYCNRFEQLQALHVSLQTMGAELQMPSMRFTTSVMEKILQPQTVRDRAPFYFLAAMLSITFSALALVIWLPSSSTPSTILLPLSALSNIFAQPMVMSTLILINIALLLILLDRQFLKPYFEQKFEKRLRW